MHYQSALTPALSVIITFFYSRPQTCLPASGSVPVQVMSAVFTQPGQLTWQDLNTVCKTRIQL